MQLMLDRAHKASSWAGLTFTPESVLRLPFYEAREKGREQSLSSPSWVLTKSLLFHGVSHISIWDADMELIPKLRSGRWGKNSSKIVKPS